MRVLSARWIIPISSPPIKRGWMRIVNGRVQELGSGSVPSDAEDLGDVALLPGLVNAHTHLEFSDCRQPIGEPGVPLTQWIGQVVATRHQTTHETRNSAIQQGMRELVESGTCLAGEIATPPSQYSEEIDGLEFVTFAEVLGLSPARAADRFEAAKRHQQQHPSGGWSPHAPYSTMLETIDACIKSSQQDGRPLAMHVAESPAERELLCRGVGPFADALRSLGVWRAGLFPWSQDPFGGLIDQLATAKRSLLVHGNDLNDAEIERLARHDNITVVYCPRTHHFFRYSPHPVDRMIAQGVRVALGTDSRASNPDLNLWREVQHLLRHRPDIRPSDVLRMATLHGAEALGKSEFGRIEIGCHAALGHFTTEAESTDKLYEDCLHYDYVPLASHAH